MMESAFRSFPNPLRGLDVLVTAAHGVKSGIRQLLPDWAVQINTYYGNHGSLPNIIRPVTFNEKLLYRNLFDRRPLLTQMTDKAAARSYVEARLGPRILPK